MTGFQAVEPERPPAAVLLVMLPPVRYPLAQPPSGFAADLATLQTRLGAAVQVLQIDEASYPAILRSFAPTQLPTSVLMHHGVELWRRPGLPDAAEIDALLVGKNGQAGA
ncbi:thioredoxin [Hymenobacter negativus]|uniref:Thioredoxin n=1 Tax=Hymenobacter negativus TaxID=2795026 RepID=A0ABS0Q8Z3_9BACT|nr:MULTISPECIES: thioredoxin [Bacteria]MBH8559052.1 thioredoxin [Hymenobacter negativus]MBH8567440.1 thioredoxin [Hymenobacter negativus]MBR7207172.1 hypothetical protein [Microvirga sp. STS02]